MGEDSSSTNPSGVDLALLRVVRVDVRGLELVCRMFASLALGACLPGVSFLYSKFRSEIRKWL